MFALKVLGGAALEGVEGPIGGPPAQKRRLALLALLAMSRTNRLPREKLVGFLWPDRDEESARRLLSDAIYVLNRALGSDTLAGIGNELRLNPERIACDARLFEEAATRDPEQAVRLYTGPFLDGFFLENSDEFETWVTRERERLTGVFAGALEQVALAREADGDERRAIEAWRRLAVEDPYNTRVAVRLANALDRSGDRAGALQLAQAHAAFLKKELGLLPTVELRELTTALQTPPQDSAPPPRSEAHVDSSPPASSETTVEPVIASVQPAAVALAPKRRRLWWTLAAAAVAVAIVAFVARWRYPGSDAPVHSIAVMPFDDVGGDGASGPYLGDGLADELTTYLGRQTDLKVAARTSAFALNRTSMDARAIGDALRVETLLEGSVRRVNDRVRVAVRLVNARDGYQIWSATLDRSVGEISAVHEQIGLGVIRALNVGARSAGTTTDDRRTVPPDSYHLYLQGRYLWHQRTRESLTRAANAFERAVALAPDYAQAYSGLADAYAVLGFYDYLPPADAFPPAKAAARRALELDPRLAEAHASLGYVALYYDWNWAEAEAAFERAIALNPSYSVGHQWYANYLTARGRFDDAVAAMRRARELDPLSLVASAALGWVHYFRRDFDAAAEQCRRTLELNPRFELAHLWAGWAHEASGRFPDALEHLTTAVQLSGGGAVALASLGRAQALSGNRDAARQTLARLHREHAGYLPAFELAKLHLALDEPDEAIAWLERARDTRSHSFVFLAVDPQLAPLRHDRRFRMLQASIEPIRPIE